MVIRMAESDDAMALGRLYESKRLEWDRANEDVPADDDSFVVVAERLGIPLPPPTIHNDDMGTSWCDVCGSAVVIDDRHIRWHVRLMAASKVAMYQAMLAHLGAQFCGITLRLALKQADGQEQEWTPSGHGWIYLQGDPPGTIRARCGGPAMCGKCRADEQRSIAEGDGAAQAYYVRMQDERG